MYYWYIIEPCGCINRGITFFYSWKRDGVIVTDNSNTFVHNNGTLYIRSVTDNFIGRYTCTATSVNDQSNSREARIQFACKWNISVRMI